MKSVEREIQIEFFDIDQMGIVWNGRYFDFFEVARHALFEECGTGYQEMARRGCMLPLTRNKAKYIKPLRHGQKIIVKATFVEYDILIRIRFEIRDKESGVVTTTGESTQMATDLEGNSIGLIPAFIRDAIKEHFDE